MTYQPNMTHIGALGAVSLYHSFYTNKRVAERSVQKRPIAVLFETKMAKAMIFCRVGLISAIQYDSFIWPVELRVASVNSGDGIHRLQSSHCVPYNV